jgi:Protein of unknown function (DUF4019)
MTQPLRRAWPSLVLSAGLAAVLAFGPARAEAPADHAAEVSAATEQAGRWLAALDAGRYDEGWDGLAAVMRQGNSKEDWTNDVKGPREHFGKPVMRELQHADFSTVVRGAPTGNYVTAAYLSQFTAAPPILETVLLTFEGGRWRVAGYSVGHAPEAPASAPPAESSPAPAKPGG